jgi:hypothetical protein
VHCKTRYVCDALVSVPVSFNSLEHTLQFRIDTLFETITISNRKEEFMPRTKKSDCKSGATPARQIGRVNDANWQLILAAVERSGKNKTQWITDVLLKAAHVVLKK